MEEGIEIRHEAVSKFDSSAISTFIRFTKRPGFLVWLTYCIVISAKRHQGGKLSKTYEDFAVTGVPEATNIYTDKGNAAHSNIQAHRDCHRNIFPLTRVVTCP